MRHEFRDLYLHDIEDVPIIESGDLYYVVNNLMGMVTVYCLLDVSAPMMCESIPYASCGVDFVTIQTRLHQLLSEVL